MVCGVKLPEAEAGCGGIPVYGPAKKKVDNLSEAFVGMCIHITALV
jgi:hypothetical protein